MPRKAKTPADKPAKTQSQASKLVSSIFNPSSKSSLSKSATSPERPKPATTDSKPAATDKVTTEIPVVSKEDKTVAATKRSNSVAATEEPVAATERSNSVAATEEPVGATERRSSVAATEEPVGATERSNSVAATEEPVGATERSNSVAATDSSGKSPIESNKKLSPLRSDKKKSPIEPTEVPNSSAPESARSPKPTPTESTRLLKKPARTKSTGKGGPSQSSKGGGSGGPPGRGGPAARQPDKAPLRKLLRVASVACGIQFGWALQLSLLTPYVQQLGVPHKLASIIWLCGPISGFFIQPLVGHLSDGCKSRFGRRRPFIVGGALSIVVAVLIVGHSADIGWMLGDTEKSKPMAIVAFIIGFWLLDVANNVTQGPCRALLGDLTGNDHRRTRVANAYFSLFMAIGNILGYATGAYSSWYKIFTFTLTDACNQDCANLKSAFFLDVIIIVITTYISILAADEIPLNSPDPQNQQLLEQSGQAEEPEAFFWEIFGTFKFLPGPVWIIMLVTALTWIGWFPFLLYDTDWMGRDIYGGEPNIGQNYNKGVRMGALGLLLNSVFLGGTSLMMEVLCRRLGAGVVWGISNIMMTICFIAMIVISHTQNNMAVAGKLPSDGIVVAALVVFAILGIPLAITYSVPYALISSRIESLGLGQGLSMGVLNLAIVIPQIIVSLGSGPWDQLFGGGNSPAIAVAAVASFVSGLIAILGIKSRSMEKSRSRR